MSAITQSRQPSRLLSEEKRNQLVQQWRQLQPRAVIHFPKIIRLSYEPAAYPEFYTLYRVELGYYHYEYRVEWWLIRE